jgi:hypothetical protein
MTPTTCVQATLGAGLTVGIESADTDGSAAANSAVNTVSVGYTMGAMTVSYDSDDKATTATNPVGNHYDAKITYHNGRYCSVSGYR